MSTLSKPSSFLWIILPRLVGPLGKFHQEFDCYVSLKTPVIGSPFWSIPVLSK